MQRVTNNFVDLTASGNVDTDGFDVSKAVAAEDRFGSHDPYDYVDAAQAGENIKALLEGAFEEDEEDKPKKKLRKREKGAKKDSESATEALTKGMKSLDVSKSKKDQSVVKAEVGEAKIEPPEEDDDDEEDDGIVEGLKVKLLPHQIDGVAWMMDKEVGTRKKNGVLPKGGILADDMGLGKTVQALALILSNPRPSPQWVKDNPKKKFPEAAGKGTLVVAPLALIKQWEAEIKDKVQSSKKLKVLVHHGASRTKSFEDLKKYDMVITTYQTLTSEHEGSSKEEDGLKVGCFGLHWYRVILDEAHSIKNRNAKMTKAAYGLKSVYRWCLTGTPMQNNLEELQSLIRFLQIKPYTDLKVWKDQISKPMKNGRGGLAMKRLQYFLKAFMKRRTKDVLKKDGGLKFGKSGDKEVKGDNDGFKIVGRKIELIEAKFSNAERETYDKFAARTEKSLEAMMGAKRQDYIGALVLLLRLRQLCNHRDLIRGNLKQETAIVANGGGSQRKGNLMDDDLGDVMGMFQNLSVKTKKCDICQTVIPEEDAAAGAIHCADCEKDLNDSLHVSRKDKKHSKKGKKHSKAKGRASKSRQRARKVIESEDEDSESEGEWIVPASQQEQADLGKAGGQEDEDAEGGGEWLVSDEASTSEEEISSDNQSDSEDDTTSSTSDLIPSTKIRRLLTLLDHESKAHKFIVFSEFTSMLDIIEPFLHDAGLRFVRYDGKMRNDDREASLQSLRTDPKTRILLCSLRCGSLGLNLTAASRVVILEPFWNPFVEEQAIDRVHRLNQTKDVVVYRLTIRGSVEEKIIALQEKKRELAKAAIEGGKGVGKLSMSDILQLFGRNAENDGSHGDGGLGSQGQGFLDGQTGQGSLSQGSSQQMLTQGESLWSKPRENAGAVRKGTGSTFGEAYGRRW